VKFHKVIFAAEIFSAHANIKNLTVVE